MQEVLYVPQLKHNLLIVSALTKQGYAVLFEKDNCVICRDDQLCAQGKLVSGLYLSTEQVTPTSAKSALKNVNEHADGCVHMLHRRSGQSTGAIFAAACCPKLLSPFEGHPLKLLSPFLLR